MALVFLFSVIIHEVAHGYVALRNGDPTAKIMGRLTLNPVPHIDPVGSILLPGLLLLSHAGILFGWARPVPVNPLNYRDYRWGEITVSAAGPLSNLALAVIFAFILRLSLGNIGLATLAYYGVSINIFLALFNLIPIPPLDGSHILAMLLPPEPAPPLPPPGPGGLYPGPHPLLHRGNGRPPHAALLPHPQFSLTRIELRETAPVCFRFLGGNPKKF